jgi:hypothetical protein
MSTLFRLTYADMRRLRVLELSREVERSASTRRCRRERDLMVASQPCICIERVEVKHFELATSGRTAYPVLCEVFVVAHSELRIFFPL